MNRIKLFKEYLVEAVDLDQLATKLGDTAEPVEGVTDWAAVRGYLAINRDGIKSAIESASGDRLTAMVVIKAADIYAEDMRDGVKPAKDWLGTSPIVDEDIPDLQVMVKSVIGSVQSRLTKTDPATLAKLSAEGKGIKTGRY